MSTSIVPVPLAAVVSSDFPTQVAAERAALDIMRDSSMFVRIFTRAGSWVVQSIRANVGARASRRYGGKSVWVITVGVEWVAVATSHDRAKAFMDKFPGLRDITVTEVELLTDPHPDA